MKIAFFTHYTDLYGANRSLINLIDGLEKFGHQAIVFSPTQGILTELLRKKRIDNYIIPFPVSFTQNSFNEQLIFHRIANTAKAIPAVVKICNIEKIELIYTNSSIFDIGFLISKIIHKPHVWHFREFGDLDYRVSPDFGKEIFQRLVNNTNGLVFISNSLKNYYRDIKKNSAVIYNGVISNDELKQNYLIWSNKRLKPILNFIIIGLIIPSKGQDQAVYAFKTVLQKYPNAILEIIGGGQIEWIKKIVFDNNLEANVRILGEVSNSFQYLLKSDVTLMCSKNEAMGRVTLESMATGNPVIGYNSAATTELITNGYNGLLYNGSVEDLANKMIYLIENPIIARQMGLNGINDVKENYTIEKYASLINDYIKRIVTNFEKKGYCKNYIEISGLNEFEKGIADTYNKLLQLGEKTYHVEVKYSTVKVEEIDSQQAIRDYSTQTKVSAIVSTYNSEKFIRGCLDDLINQTLYTRNELEIVIIDSGSKQNEEGIIREYQSLHKNIKYLKTDRETIYSAWNRGVKQASGIYLTNANTDDRHSPFAFEKMADFLDKNQNKNINVVYADSYVTKFENENWGTKRVKGIFKWPEYNIRHLFDICYLGPQPMWRKSLHDKFGYFDAEYQSAGDYEFWLRLSTKGVNFAHLNEILGIYYENENSVSLSNIDLNWKESEKARNDNWPKDWGTRPKTNWKSYEVPIKDNCVEHQNRGKILLLCDYFWPSIGGVEVFIEELGIQLQKEGYLIEVACRHLDDRYDYKHSGMIIHEFNILESNLNTELKDEFKKCRELILNGSYKSVIALSQPDNWIGNVIIELPVNRPQIIMLPSISANNLIEWADNGFGEKINNILKSADRIVTVSESGYDKAFSNKVNIPNIFIPHSIEKDAAHIDFRNEYGLDRSIPLLVMVANFWPVKNHDFLLEVLSHNNGEWQIVLIGKKIDREKSYYDKVIKLVERDKRVRILGALERNIAAAAIRDADILLVPSKAESAGPLVILQAMSFGTPWIAAPSCNAVKDEAGGLIAPVEEFPKAIEFIINNKEIQNELAFLGKKHWEQSFRWNKSLPLFISLMEGQEPISNLNMSEDLRKQTRLIQEEYSNSINSINDKVEKIFSIIIPTYNRAAVLEKCLNALSNQNFAPDLFEVIVCDDGSSDNTCELIKKIKVPYQLIYLKQENKGPAAARNLGIRKSTGKYLLILNDDSILNFDAMKIHNDIQTKHTGEKISVLGAFKLLPEYTQSLLSYFVNTTDSLFNYPKMTSGLLYNYEHFYTCNISILKKAAVSAGLFNETFNGPAAEDIEFGYRLEQEGYRVLYEDSCIAWHDHQITLETFCKTHLVRGYGAATLSYIQPGAYPLEYLNRSSYSELLKTMEDAEPKIKKLYAGVQEIENKGDKVDLQKNAIDLLPGIKLLQNYYVKKGILSNPYLTKIISRNSNKNNFRKNPIVSVIIPCYNYEKFLAKAVESVINQTFKDFEIIIVNDGSKDNSKEVAEDLVIKYHNEIRIR